MNKVLAESSARLREIWDAIEAVGQLPRAEQMAALAASSETFK